MTMLTLELTPSVYRRLQFLAQQQQMSIESLAERWLTEKVHIPESALPEQRATLAALRTAGLLTELSPAEKQRAAQSTLTIEEARRILDRAGTQPLSELVLELRGPKE